MSMIISFHRMSLDEAIGILKQHNITFTVDNEESRKQLVTWLEQLKELRTTTEPGKHLIGKVDL